MIRLVLFDIDGTLIRSGGAGVRAFGQAFASAFDAPQATEGVSFSGRTDHALLRECLTRIGLETTPENVTRFFVVYTKILQESLELIPGEVCPGVDDWLSALKLLPHRPAIGLLTGNIQRGAELKLRRYGLWHHFCFGGYGDDHEDRNRIAAAAYDRGAQHLGTALRGDEVLVIGDTPHDITCGRAIQAKVLAVATGAHSVAELTPHRADWLVQDLRAIGPAEICL